MAARSDAVLAPTRARRARTTLVVARRIANVIGTAISVVVVMVGCAGIVLAIATHFTKDGEYTLFGHPMMIVVSGSMSPAIDTGDLVIDNPVGAQQAAQLQVGQIVTFHSGSTVITHRIHAMTSVNGEVAYVTKGDANTAPDLTPVQPSQVVGVYDTKIARGGYVLNALHQPLTLGLLLASPALWFLSGLFFEWAKETDGDASSAQPGTAAEDAGEER